MSSMTAEDILKGWRSQYLKQFFSWETEKLIERRKYNTTKIALAESRAMDYKDTKPDLSKSYAELAASETEEGNVMDFILAYRNSDPVKRRMKRMNALARQLDLSKTRVDSMKQEAHKKGAEEAWRQWLAQKE